MAGNVSTGKSAARQGLEARRRGLTPDEVARWGGEAQSHLAALSFFRAAQTVALYAAQGFEPPCWALAEALWARGARAVFPRVMQGSRVLAFSCLSSRVGFVRSKYGLEEPAEEASLVPLDDIDLWVIPGVGFTEHGERLGRGGGYYDSTLAHARPGAVLVGYTFERCVAESLPVEAHDLKVQWLMTERGVRPAQPRVAKTQV